MTTTTTAKKMSPAEAIQRAFELGRSKIDASCYGALERGTAMLKNGGVRRDEDGLWHVRSDKHPGEFEVNGACKCIEAQVAWQGNCEHLLAVKVAQGRDLLLARGLDPIDSAQDTACGTKQETKEESVGEEIIDPDEDARKEEEPDNEDYRWAEAAEAEQAPQAEAPLADLTQLVQASVQQAIAAQPPALPEAAFSLCLKGRLHGQDAQITIRGATVEAFRANLQEARAALEEARGLLDPFPEPSRGLAGSQAEPGQTAVPGEAAEPGEGWCYECKAQMTRRGKDGDSWFSHKVDGVYCTGYGPGKKKPKS